MFPDEVDFAPPKKLQQVVVDNLEDERNPKLLAVFGIILIRDHQHKEITN